MARTAAAGVLGSARPCGGVAKCEIGSATPYDTRPMPMTALRIIANQVSVENSGRSVSLPSLMSPAGLNARKTRKTRMPSVTTR